MQILKTLPYEFSVCQLDSTTSVNFGSEYCFFARTAEEISLVCPTHQVTAHTLHREDGWRGLYIDGILDFSLIGILSKLSAVLAASQVGIFAVSTYNTDYIFVKKDQYSQAVQALRQAGYAVE